MKFIKPMSIAEVMAMFKFDDDILFIDEKNNISFDILLENEEYNQNFWNKYNVIEIIPYRAHYEFIGCEI